TREEVRARRSAAYFSSVFVFFSALGERHQNLTIRYLRLESGQFIHAARERKCNLAAPYDGTIKCRHDLQSLKRARESQRMRLALIVQPIRHLLDVWRHVVVVIHAAGA